MSFFFSVIVRAALSRSFQSHLSGSPRPSSSTMSWRTSRRCGWWWAGSTYCLPFQAPQYSHFAPSMRRFLPTLVTTSSMGSSSPWAMSCMAMGDSTLMQLAGRRAARSVMSFTYTLSQESDSIWNFRLGANFEAHSFIPSTATPPYGPGSPQTRTVPLAFDLACAKAGSAGASVPAAAPTVSSETSSRNLRRERPFVLSSMTPPWLGLVVALGAHVGGELVRHHPLGLADARDDRRDRMARLASEALVGDGLDELSHPEPAGVAPGAARGQRVIGAHALVAVGDGALLAHEEAAVVAQLREVVVVAAGLHLQVLGGIAIAHRDRLVVVAHHDHLAVVAPRGLGHRACGQRRQLPLDLAHHRFAQRARGRHEPGRA